MPVQPPNIPQGGFGGGAQQMLALAQQRSGTKDDGIFDSMISKAFERILANFLGRQGEKEEEEDENGATAGFWRAWNRLSPGSSVGGGPVGGGSFGGTLGFDR